MKNCILQSYHTQYRKRKYKTVELPEQILRTKPVPVPVNQQGDERDVVEM